MEDSFTPMEQKLSYTIAIFTQTLCGPCIELKEDVSKMHEKIQRKIEFFPIKTITGNRTAWCESLGVETTPTLVVVEDEDCDKSLRFVVGRKAILEMLQNTLLLYTDLDLKYIDSLIENVEEKECS